jgi:hypothetical protein
MSQQYFAGASFPLTVTDETLCAQVGLVAVRLTGRPLDAAETAAALDAVVAASTPFAAQPASPTAMATAGSRGLRLAPTASSVLTPSSTAPGSPSGAPEVDV